MEGYLGIDVGSVSTDLAIIDPQGVDWISGRGRIRPGGRGGSLMTARIGAYVSFKTHPYLLRKLFALFLTLVSFYIIFIR